jgi:5-methylcytosine-specific restriction endonuclease McrA
MDGYYDVCMNIKKDRINKRRKDWSKKRKATGKCLQCGGISGPKSKLYCIKCSVIFVINAKRRADRLMKQGLCIQCMKPSNSRNCQDCSNKNKKARARKVKEREELGLCVKCGKTASVPTNRKCSACYLKHTADRYLHATTKWVELMELFDKQNGFCPYTGRKLTIGLDAEIDHIISRQQGGKDELSNFQWVYFDVNRMKAHHTHEQFLNFVREIYQHCRL